MAKKWKTVANFFNSSLNTLQADDAADPMIRNQDGVRVIGVFNTGESEPEETGPWYEFAHLTAQNKRPRGGELVSVVPLLCSSDITFARKKMGPYPWF